MKQINIKLACLLFNCGVVPPVVSLNVSFIKGVLQTFPERSDQTFNSTLDILASRDKLPHTIRMLKRQAVVRVLRRK